MQIGDQVIYDGKYGEIMAYTWDLAGDCYTYDIRMSDGYMVVDVPESKIRKTTGDGLRPANSCECGAKYEERSFTNNHFRYCPLYR